MHKGQVTIIYATNNSYAPYMAISIYSLIKNTSDDIFYKIYILYEVLAEHYKKRIGRMSKCNVEIEFLNVSENMKNKGIITTGHLSKEATHRLLVDIIFPEYEKVLYIDCDTIINNDVALLYNEDVSDYILGATVGILPTMYQNYVLEDVGVAVESFFNSGVMVINIPMFHKCKVRERCFDLLQTKGDVWKWMDQDVLNVTCNGMVKYLDGKWNAEWIHVVKKNLDYVWTERHKQKKESMEAAYILHYASDIKPWSHPEMQFAELFWKYARKTEFYEEIVLKNMR